MNIILLGSRWLVAGTVGPPWVAVEALLVVGTLSLLPRRNWALWMAAVTGLLVLPILVLALADATARLSLARPLNLYLDFRLAGAVVNLMTGSLGPGKAVLWGVGLTLGILGATGSLVALFLRLPSGPGLTPLRYAGMAALLVGSLGLVQARVPGVLVPAGVAGASLLPFQAATPLVDLVFEQHRYLMQMLGERERFAGEMEAAPADYAHLPGLLEGLGGRDVVMAFVESYGMSSQDDPRYAPLVRPRLDSLEVRMSRAGLTLATGQLEAPIQGGQSWLGHGSVLTGLWLSNQFRYELYLAGNRENLVDDFHRGGYASVAIMPAITMAWPEGERFGYNRIFPRQDIPYRGPPLNWVTMPDQFTWCFLEHDVRRRDRERPLFMEVALISSHAPWTPILPVLSGCDEVGDGSVFQPWADAGERPEELWLDTERVREHFALAVDYALHAAMVYAETYVDDGLVLIVLGDHQPAPLITGDSASMAVPVHIIAQDPEVVRPFLEWGFSPGAYPDPQLPVLRMDAFRDWFVRAFTPGAE
ncbi:MAG: sulfatase [Gemmatimonadota bacterium]